MLCSDVLYSMFFFFFQAEDGIRDKLVTGVQTCALPISRRSRPDARLGRTVRRLACRDPGGRHVPLVVCPLGRLPGLPATTAADPRPSRGDDCREPTGGGRERALLPCRLGHHPERRGY